MTVRINKPAINLREKLAELDKPSGLTGEELLRSQTSEEARNSLDLEEHLFENFESTGIDDNATSTKVTVSDSGVDVTGTVTADGLTVDGDAIAQSTSSSTTFEIKSGQEYATTGESKLVLRALNSASGTSYSTSEIVSVSSGGGDNDLFLRTTTDPSGAQNRIKIDSDGDVSFYEDTGTTAKFVWDSSYESLDIGGNFSDSVKNFGTNTKLAIGGSIVLDGGSGNDVDILNYRTSNLNLGTGGSTDLTIDSSGNVGIGTASPSAQIHIGGSSNGKLRIDTTASGYLDCSMYSNGAFIGTSSATQPLRLGTNNSERARIDSSGNLLVGKTATGSGVDGFSYVASASATQLSRTSGDALSVNRNSTDGNIAVFRKDGSTVGSIGVVYGDNLFIGGNSTHSSIGFGNNTVYPATATGAGNDADIDLGDASSRFKDLYLSGGVYLGGTGSANKLDDYEEGNWTPTIRVSTTDYSASSIVTAKYVKIGNLVHCYAHADFSGLPSTTGDLVYLQNLPFSANGIIPCNVSISETYSDSNLFVASEVQKITGGTMETNNRVLLSDGGSAYVRSNALNTSGKFMFSVTYHTTA